ncbi:MULTISPECIES: FAD/NAD(P)-binding protein [unclassified Nocardiopsis]|uniref:FAD/NAD(P)-binding protein n=1 Tax=Nocardiopsis TaxID=2013 RepID=UPI00387B2A78
MSTPERPLRIAVVGAGPRATSLLERIAANLPDLPPRRALEVCVVDPHPPGGGRIWRHDQSPWLWMNTTAGDCTMFTDTSVTCTGPVAPGPTLTEWACDLASGSLYRPPGFTSDGTDLAEARRVHRDWFATRRLQSRYLSWVFHWTAERAPAGLTVRTVEGRAVDLRDRPDGTQRLVLADGGVLDADLVVLAQGNGDTAPTPEEERLAAHAAEHGLVYVPTASTADIALDAVPAGEPVLVRGLGLAFIDTVVLLTSGRGGTFRRDADGTLRYEPSGREPVLWAGSRRGVPYHSKLHYDLPGPRPALPRHLDRAALAALGAGPLDLREDVWPLVVRELAHAHYTELARSHPERLAIGAAEFLERLEAADPWEDRVKELVAEAVPREADVFDVERIDRPLAGLRFAGHDALGAWLEEYIAADLERRRDPAYSMDLAVFFALLSVFTVLGEAMADGTVSAESAAREFPGFMGFFSFLASGPPGPRLEEMLALARAGVLRFTGADTAVEAVPGGFEARSASTDATVTARALLEARLPAPSLERTTDPLLLALRERGEIRAREHGGLVDADPADQRLRRADGEPHPARFGLGALVAGGVGAGGFSRPRTNAGFFRQNDAVARILLAALA